MLADYRRRRDFVVKRLREIPGVKCEEPRGAFYAFPNVSAVLGKNGLRTSLELTERLLAEARVAVVPGEAFGVDRHIRISYAASMQNLKRGLDRIHQFIVDNS
jgi:aspartate aminotransferase